MKKFIYFTLVSMVILGLNSCDSDPILDNKPLDKFSELDVWTDNNLATAFVHNIYNDVVRGLWSQQTTDDWTDNVVNNSDNGWARAVQSGNFENTADVGWNRFGTIRKCNLTIEKLSDPDCPINEDVKKKLIAEARMLRGMTYFWQARRFGGLILVDKVLGEEDDLKLARSSERETYDFILADLDHAAANLPESAGRGELTSYAAHAFITMAALQIGDYDKVIAAADAVEAGGFSLDANYYDIFNNYTTTINSSEAILLYERGEDHNDFRGTRMFRATPNVSNGQKLHADAVPQLNDVFNAWPLRWPSQELVDSYLVVEGGNAVVKAFSDFQGMPSEEMWKNRDARFEKSIVRDNSIFHNSTVTFRRGGNMHWTSNPLSTWGMPKSGYIIRKWNYEGEYIFFNSKLDWAEAILRLGEVFLNKAEAYARKGDLANAVAYTNRTRVAHGELPALDAGVSAADFWKFYKIERRVELAYEDDRYWSLIRWARAENAVNIPELNGYRLHGLDMEADGIMNVIECPFTVEMNFEMPKRLFFPVPDGEIRNNENLNQNPNW